MAKLKVYTVAVGKGGVGKSMTVAELMFHLASCGQRVGGIDLCRQSNFTERCGIDSTEYLDPARGRGRAIPDVLRADCEISEAFLPAPTMPPGAQIIPAAHDLADIEKSPPVDIVTSLRDSMAALNDAFDAIVIDTPPSMGYLTQAALVAADVVIAPVTPSFEAYKEVLFLADYVAAPVLQRVRKGLQVNWVLPCIAELDDPMLRDLRRTLDEDFPDRVTNPIRVSRMAKKSIGAGMTISAYRPKSTVAGDYATAMEQITGLGRKS